MKSQVIQKQAAHPSHIGSSQQSAVGSSVTSALPPGYGIDFLDGPNRTGLPGPLKASLENLSGLSMDDVKVHYNSDKPAQLQALAYTQGAEIHVAPGEERHLPHEAWHVVQQKQGRVAAPGNRVNGVAINNDSRLEAEADHMGAQARTLSPTGPQQHLRPSTLGSHQDQPVQRQVRINGGAARVNEADYLSGGSKSATGSKRKVSALIADAVHRVFADVAELDDYADGKTDHIGDVATASAGTYWYRLPKNQLTVLGESHHNVNGNVEDVILGLQTSRFMYEPFNEAVSTSALNIPLTGTQSQVNKINSGIKVAGLVDRTKFNPDLENIVIKALTGASITRNQFIAAGPATMSATKQKQWGSRASTNDYSIGERAALYLAMGIHLAKDISLHNFGPPNFVESLLVSSGRALKEYYLANKAVLDSFMTTKDGDDLIGIYELTKASGFKDLPVLNDFTLALHEYASRYIEQLGAESGNKKLETEGQGLATNTGATLTTLSPAREEIMWEKIQKAKGYLIVGMGDAHRTNLTARLNLAGIPHEEVEASLKRQRSEVNTKWVP